MPVVSLQTSAQSYIVYRLSELIDAASEDLCPEAIEHVAGDDPSQALLGSTDMERVEQDAEDGVPAATSLGMGSAATDLEAGNVPRVPREKPSSNKRSRYSYDSYL